MRISKINARRAGLLFVLATAFTLQLLGLSSASAAPVWSLTALSNTTAAPGGTLEYAVTARNIGDEPTDLSTYELTVTLPPGLKGLSSAEGGGLSCPGIADATVITCTGENYITFATTLPATVTLVVSVDPAATGVLTSRFSIEGGGAPEPASTVDPVRISSTPPGFGIDAFDAAATDAAGEPMTQAGGHPSTLRTSIDFNTFTDPSPAVGRLRTVEAVKDILVDLPPGFLGNPTAADRCTIADLTNVDSGDSPAALCSPTSQIGTTTVTHSGTPDLNGTSPVVLGPVPVYNMVPPPDVPARFGFVTARVLVLIDAKPRSGGDYGITARVTNVSEGLAIVGTTLELWGVPADPSHTDERACYGQVIPLVGGPTCPSGAELRPFFRNPTSCTPDGVGLVTRLHLDSWQHPGLWQEGSFVSHLLPGYPLAPQDWGPSVGIHGCGAVPFTPAFEAQPSAGQSAGAPGSMSFDVSVPQADTVEGISQSDLRSTVVTLPQGVRVNPSSADGLQGCSSAQIALASEAAPTCPDGAKIGTVQIDTPLLEEPVKGHLFLAAPFDNPFDSLVAVYIVAGARGVTLKLPGRVSLGEDGRITTSFDNTPQLPFSNLHLELKTGPRAPLSVADRCGQYTTHAVLSGWSGSVVEQSSSFALNHNASGRPCPPEFSPSLHAGVENPLAGAHSSFGLQVKRSDEDQEISSLQTTMPPGLSAVLKGVPVGSQVGTLSVGAGAGSNPFYIDSGRVLLGGPYKGAPLSLLFSVPALAGPFDLGLVEVRAAVRVDPQTAQVTVDSDPLPQMLQGIPLSVRDIRVEIDRPDFILNPTNCDEMRVEATLTSTEGLTASPAERFQLAECANLGFKPKLALRLHGGTHRNDYQGLSATVTYPKRGKYSNIARAAVTLPHAAFLEQNHIRTVCTRVRFAADACPAGSVYGRARARTPILGYPLRGPVYLRSSNNPLPDLVAKLRGPDSQPIEIDLAGRTDSVKGALRNTFAVVPDTPVERFHLELFGGKRALIVLSSDDYCAKNHRADVRLEAHDADRLRLRPLVRNPKCLKHKKKRHGR